MTRPARSSTAPYNRSARPAPAWADRLNGVVRVTRLSSSMLSSLARPARGEPFDENYHSIVLLVTKAFVAKDRNPQGGTQTVCGLGKLAVSLSHEAGAPPRAPRPETYLQAAAGSQRHFSLFKV